MRWDVIWGGEKKMFVWGGDNNVDLGGRGKKKKKKTFLRVSSKSVLHKVARRKWGVLAGSRKKTKR